MKTVCLSMIVKNEARVIARCLNSVRPLITSWVIVDTGSTDGTQEIIKEALKDIPGELHQEPWIDFAHNRNQAIEIAQRTHAEYLLVVDADDVLEIPAGYVLPELTCDAYRLLVLYGATSYWRTHLFRSDRGYRYEGVVHEVLHSTRPCTEERLGRLQTVVYRVTTDGARSKDSDKYRKDALLLEAALKKDPTNARHAFYLAQSWRDASELVRALDAYEHRAEMSGFEEEGWYSLLEMAKLRASLQQPTGAVIDAFLRAFERRPSRAESLCYLAQYLRQQGRTGAAYPFARIAADTPRPDDILFVDESVYAWRALDELAISAYYAKQYRQAMVTNQRLLESDNLPNDQRDRVQKNLEFCRTKYGDKNLWLNPPFGQRRLRRGG